MRCTTNLGCALAEDGGTALIDLGGETGVRVYAYADIESQADAVARGLAARGLRPGERVAILAANRAEYLIAFLGILRAGLVAVPVNHKLPAATVAFVLEDCDARLAICDSARRPLVPAAVRCIVLPDGWNDLLDPGPFTAVALSPDEPAMFLYTSGSTGRPKGVVLSHRSHLWVLQVRSRAPARPGRRVLVAAPLYHMNALAMSQVTLATGSTVVLLPGFTAASYIQAAVQHRVDALTAVPTMIAMVLRERALLAGADLRAVETIRVGSAPLSKSLAEGIRATFPRAELSNGYGTTEAGPVVFGPHADGLPRPDLSPGAAHPEVELRLRSGGHIVADEGVLEMRGPAMMNGYHKLPDATRKAITADGFYITGDVFRRDADGFFFFVGRTDDMFVCGGENVYPGEVEKVLEAHPAVAQACVVPIPDELKGHKPVAFVVRHAPVTEDQLRRFALANAPAYAHPRRVWFIDSLPLAGTNKVDRRHLMQRALEDVP
ncbi:MAG TPA: class I adenylate-forming enzyme family protein [Acetobacteraceae bacterium]|nr:class I adenylate-forming enzyme family protein [Acetobacteraceae bacterium]